ncbi:MAG TPA: hypothetical protein VLG76_02920 [Rhabdochlamydiaceae bacterium]|nr:hypothetical protein [Rhabdochlamydiaceae bacterium]
MSSIDRIKFEIAFDGSSQFFGQKDTNVCAIDLVGTKSEISAESDRSRGDSSLKAGRLKWCTPNNNDLDQIALTPKVAKAIQLTARVFESYNNPWKMIKGLDGVTRPEQRVRRYDIPITIEDHPEFETGKCYLIKVQKVQEHRLKATFTKIDEQPTKTPKDENEEKKNKAEVQRRMRKMGEELIKEGIKNLQLASRGGAPVFNSSSTPADVFAHVAQGTIRAAQQMNPEIRVPDTKPSESAADLDCLSQPELQSRFEEVYIKDKQFERQRLQAARAGDIREFNRITAAEHANNQLLINLTTALEKKGFKAEIPQSAIDESREIDAERSRAIKEACKVQ